MDNEGINYIYFILIYFHLFFILIHLNLFLFDY